MNYPLSARVKSFSHICDIYSLSHISGSEISVHFLNNPPISLLDSSPNDCVFSLNPHLSLSKYSSLHSNSHNYDLESFSHAEMHVMTSYKLSSTHFNTPQTIQSPSSLVDFLLVSYAVLLISNSFKSCIFFIGCLSMTLVIL